MKETRVEKVLGLCFLGIGALLAVTALICAVVSFKTKGESEKLTAKIIDIYGSGIEVSYTYEGEEYERNLSEYSSTMQVGDKIELYVNRENPRKVQTGMLLFLPTFILSMVGIPFLAVGAGFVIAFCKKAGKKKALLQNGRLVNAVVNGGQMNFNISVNGRHPWKLECQYEDPYTGAVYLYSSNNIWEDPNFYIGQPVQVYVDRERSDSYYVDVSSLKTGTNGGQVFDYR